MSRSMEEDLLQPETPRAFNDELTHALAAQRDRVQSSIAIYRQRLEMLESTLGDQAQQIGRQIAEQQQELIDRRQQLQTAQSRLEKEESAAAERHQAEVREIAER